MDFSIKTFDAINAIGLYKSGCIAVGIFDNGKLSSAAKSLDTKGTITAAVKRGDITGKAGSTLLLHGLSGTAAERILLVGLGAEDAVTDRNFISSVQSSARVFSTLGCNDALFALPLDVVRSRDSAWALRTTVVTIRESLYRTDELKSKKDAPKAGVKKLGIVTDTTSRAPASACNASTTRPSRKATSASMPRIPKGQAPAIAGLVQTPAAGNGACVSTA